MPLLEHDTRWHEVHDDSARQKTELLLGGKVGRLTYGPEAAPYRALLEVGEITGVGKNTTSGNGRIAVRAGE